MTPRRNVLIFHSGALGDFILTWPLAVALGRLLPQSRIFYMTHGQKGKLAEKVLGVESVDAEGGWHPLFAADATLPPPAAHLLARAQWVFTFVAGEGSVWTGNVARLAPEARVVSLSQAPPAHFPGHLTDYLVEQLRPWPPWQQGVSQILGSVALRGIAPRRAAASPADPAGGLTVIHPGSGSPHKCWPAGSFLELARRLAGAGRRPRVVIGEVEAERWPAGRTEAFAEVAELRRPQTLVELWECYAGAARFVGNDSGPGHLAAVLGIPTLCLFGPTDPALWRPLGPQVRVIRKEPLEALGVEEVIGALPDRGS